jgi:hypothetical protein
MTTIVIVPTVALAGDIVRTCKEKNVGCIQYGSCIPVSLCPCRRRCRRDCHHGDLHPLLPSIIRLSRVVFDECHAIEMDADYGEKFRKLRRLEYGVQNEYCLVERMGGRGRVNPRKFTAALQLPDGIVGLSPSFSTILFSFSPPPQLRAILHSHLPSTPASLFCLDRPFIGVSASAL